jgi:hypothetical protein
MNDGGYSRLEKDFLGNERMVHYDAAGNMLGASDVIREADGTMRVSNDPVPLQPTNDLPPVEAVVPTPKPASPDPVSAKSLDFSQKPSMPTNQVVMYFIATFIAASLVTLGILSFLKSSGGSGAGVQMSSQPSTRASIPETSALPTPAPEREPEPDSRPSDPRPRNDEQPSEPRPFDQTAPDSNMDDSRPRIKASDPTEPNSKPDPKPKQGKGEDPLDLRGDSDLKADPPKKGDPGEDPLRGDGTP